MLMWVDYTIFGIIGISTVISLIRGFVREALSVVSWIAAFFVAKIFYAPLATFLTGLDDVLLKNASAIAILFISTLVIFGIVNHIIGILVDKTGLSGTDRLLGMCFGALRGILVVAAGLFFLDAFTGFSSTQDWAQSQLIPKFEHIIKWFFDYLKSSSSFLSDYVPNH